MAVIPHSAPAIERPLRCRVGTAGLVLAACLALYALPAWAVPVPTVVAVAPETVADTVAEGIARSYLEAVRRRDWSAATQLIHSAALGRFKGAFVLLAAGDTGRMLVTDLFQLPDIETLEKMSEPQLYQRFMERVGASIIIAGAAPVPDARLDILGTVAESETLKHIVYRVIMTVDGAPLPTIGVLTVRREGVAWKVELASEIEAMIGGIRRGMAR